MYPNSPTVSALSPSMQMGVCSVPRPVAVEDTLESSPGPEQISSNRWAHEESALEQIQREGCSPCFWPPPDPGE